MCQSIVGCQDNDKESKPGLEHSAHMTRDTTDYLIASNCRNQAWVLKNSLLP